MTYNELIEHLKGLTKEQLNSDVTILTGAEAEDGTVKEEYYPLQTITLEDNDVVEKQITLVI